MMAIVNNFKARALELAVTEFRVLTTSGDPVTPAAFGIATAHLQERLNLTLIDAATMLRGELDRIMLNETQRELRAIEEEHARARLETGMSNEEITRAEMLRDLGLTKTDTSPQRTEEGEPKGKA